jgi:hypothetical protein
MHLINDPVIFRGKPNHIVVDINDVNPSEPKYMVANNTTDHLYSFWVTDEDLEYDYNVLENAS